jgi:phage-related protein
VTEAPPFPWRVVYYQDHAGRSPVIEFIKRLSEPARAAVLRDVDLLKEFGLALGAPMVKPIAGVRKLWELRVKTKDGAVRIFYVAISGRRFVMLHGFMKKTDKTPKPELEIARKRLEAVLAEESGV